MKQPTVPISIRLNARMYDRVSRAAHRLRRDKSQIVRDALEVYFGADSGERNMVQRIVEEREGRELTRLLERGYYLIHLGSVVIRDLPANASLFDRAVFAEFGIELRQLNVGLRDLTRALSRVVFARRGVVELGDKSPKTEGEKDV